MGLLSLKSNNNRKLAGFSMIELLTVIGTMSILMSVLLPSLRLAKERGKAVYCMNNLRQMAIAANSYAASSKEHYPLAYASKLVDGVIYFNAWDFSTSKDWKQSPPKEVVAPGLLWQGNTNEKVHQCPSYNQSANWLSDPYTGYNYNTSYVGMNETVIPNNSARTTEVLNPSSIALFGDGHFIGGANKFMRAPFPNPRDVSFSGRYSGTQGYRHAEKTNVAFCDGRVQAIQELFTQTDSFGQEAIEKHNQTQKIKVGFLSPDNSAYKTR